MLRLRAGSHGRRVMIVNILLSFDLLNLCGLPLPAQNQAEEIRRLMEKMDHLITVQIQTS